MGKDDVAQASAMTVGARTRSWWDAIRPHLPVIGELLFLAVWALVVGRDYLNLGVVIPSGREFLSSIQSHFLWPVFKECGTCAFWNGFERGGYPAFADPYGSALHPVVAVLSLAFGVLSGAKIGLVVAFWLAGLGQWWLARTMGLGRVTRLWTAMMAVVGGHLAGRMEIGVFGVVLATAMTHLVFAGMVAVYRSGTWRATALLGLALGGLLLAGQAYVQVGMLGVTPALLWLILDEDAHLSLIWRKYLVAGLLGVLLAGPFLVPLLHFMPQFTKDINFQSGAGQPLGYYVLNLVIPDDSYLRTEVLGKLPYPYLYTMYIGWVPVILALLCLWLGQRKDRWVLAFLATSAFLALLWGSGAPQHWIGHWLPAIGMMRFPTLAGGAAIPPILGLAGYALEKIWQAQWPQLVVRGRTGGMLKLGGLQWLMIVPLVFALFSSYAFARHWIHTIPPDPQVAEFLPELVTPNLEWVEPPFGEHRWIEPALKMRLKLSPGIMTWNWKDRTLPLPMRKIDRQEVPPDSTVLKQAGGLTAYQFSDMKEREYAAVSSDQGWWPCEATGLGGAIRVQCPLDSSGILVVRENNWSGWKAWRDGERVVLHPGMWLAVDHPGGDHVYRFSYKPWDVPVGLALCGLGLLGILKLYVTSANDA